MALKIKCPFLVITTLFMHSCGYKSRELKYFIPENYDGEVKIYWNLPKSQNRIFAYKDDSYVLIITGDPSKYMVKDESPPSGPYNIDYYYYSKDTVYQINSSPVKTNLPEFPTAENGSTGGVKNSYDSFFVKKSSTIPNVR